MNLWNFPGLRGFVISGLLLACVAPSVDAAVAPMAAPGAGSGSGAPRQLPPPMRAGGGVDLRGWVNAARERADRMRELMRSNPQAFARGRVTDQEFAELPPEVAQFVERRVRGRGFFGVYCAVPRPDGDGLMGLAEPGIRYEVVVNGRRYEAYAYGAWQNQRTLRDVEIDGVALEDSIVIGESPTPDVQVAAGAMGFGDSPNLGGANRLLYIIARFSDESAEPVAEDTALAQMGVVSAFWRNNSSGTVWLEGLVRPDLVMDVAHVILPQPMSYGSTYNSNFSQLIADARAAAQAAGFAYADYSLDVVVTSNQGFGYAGRAYIGGQGAHLIKGYTSLRTAGHELGHNLGLYHANYWRTDSTHPYGADAVPGGYVADSSNAEWVEYGHAFSVMSAQSGAELDDATKPHYAVAEKADLGWLAGAEVAYVSGSGVHRLFRHDHPATTGTPRAIRIETPATPAGSVTRYYWLSHRCAPWSAGQNWLQHGLQVDVCQAAYGNDGAIMLDMTPYSKDAATPFFDPASKPGGWWTIDNEDKKDGALVIGRTFSDAAAGIHVTPVATGNNGTNEEYIDVVINLGHFPGNRPPVIQSFLAAQLQASVNQSVDFSVAATDPDGDPLAFAWDFDQVQTWTASGLNQPQATKSWSSAGQYRVRVTVSDMKGGATSESLVVTVGTPANVRQIWGRVIWGGEPVADARVSAQSGTTVYSAWTDADGTYVLTDIPSTASCTLGCVAPGLTFTGVLTNPVSVAAGDVYGADFLANEPRGATAGMTLVSISGTVTDGGLGAGGVEVSGGSRVAVTDAAGRYSLTNLLAGSYTVTAHQQGWTLTPASRSVTVGTSDVTGTDFARSAPYTLSGRLTGLPVGSQDPAPTVYLSNGRSVRATRQGGGANRYWGYTLSSVPAGSWSLTAELAGYRLSPATFTNPLTLSASRSGLDFSSSTGAVAGAVEGRVTECGLALAGVTVTFKQGGVAVATAVTDSDGSFRSPSLAAGGCEVAPAKPGYVFVPGSLMLAAVPASGVDFLATGPAVPPSIQAVSAAPAVLSSVDETTQLTAAASGNGVLSYSWSLTQGPAPVSFSANDSTGAASTVAAFQVGGDYEFGVRVTDAQGFTASTNVMVRVEDGPGRMVVAPYEVVVMPGQQVTFSARAWDALGAPVAVTPEWTVQGGGVIDAAGRFTAGAGGGMFEVAAQAGLLSATARVTIVGGALPVVTVQAGDGLASEWGSNPGQVTLTRSTTGAGLTVNLDLAGTAVVGTDYELTGVDSRQGSRATVTFGAAEATRVLVLTPKIDTQVEGVEEARLSVASDVAYTTGASREAVVQIEDAPFDAWRRVRFSAGQLADPTQSGEGADPDLDGLCNLVEYACGTDPNVADRSGAPSGAVRARHLVFTYRESKMAPDVSLSAEVCNDLAVGDWTTSALEEISRTDQGTYWEVQVRDAVIIPYEVSRFMRLKVTRR